MIPEDIIFKMNESFEYDSFHKDLLYTIEIKSFDNLNVSLYEHINNINILLDNSIKILHQEVNVTKTNTKESKSLYLEAIELAIRKQISSIIKQNNKVSSKTISITKKEYMRIIKILLFNKNEENIKLNLEDYISIINLINITKLSNYDMNNLNEYVKLFESFLRLNT